MCVKSERLAAAADGVERPSPDVLADDARLREWRGRPIEPADAGRLLAPLADQPSAN